MCRSEIPHYQPIVALSDTKIVGFKISFLSPNSVHFAGCLTGEQWKKYKFEDNFSRMLKRFEQDLPYLPKYGLDGEKWLYFLPVSRKIILSDMLITFARRYAHLKIVAEISSQEEEIGYSKSYLKKLQELKKAGVLIALSKVGSAPLSNLNKIPFDLIRVDRQFTIETRQTTLLFSFLELLKNFSMPILVDGLETATICKKVRKTGTEYGQGRLFGKPVPLQETLKKTFEFEISAGQVNEIDEKLTIWERILLVEKEFETKKFNTNTS